MRSDDDGRMAAGLLYHHPEAPRYDLHTAEGIDLGSEEKLAALDRELDRFAV